MHGVQPTPKRNPSSGAPTRPPVVEIFGFTVGIIGNKPRKMSPIKMVNMPSTWVISSSLVATREPIAPKRRPYEMKSALNPATNRSEPRNTFPRDFEKPAAKAR